MGKITTQYLPDMQKTQTGFYKKRIAKVGVRGIKQYIPIQMKNGEVQNVLANISSYCSLDETFKGINMSRITRTINKVLTDKKQQNGFRNLEAFVKELVEAHNSPDVYIKAKFLMLINSSTPMSDLYSQEPIEVTIESQFREKQYKTFLTVETVAMSLCPCSKEMSLMTNNLNSEEVDALQLLGISKLPVHQSLYNKIIKSGFGAHNQRSHINIKVELKKNSDEVLWIEDVYHIALNASSCPTRSVLKREDEKFVTEVSYLGGYYDDDKTFIYTNGGPKFVEDIARAVAEQLDKQLDKTINDYVIVVNNEESIHTGDIMATSVLNAGRELK